MSVMLSVIDGWSGCLRRKWILMPKLEVDVKEYPMIEHENGVLKFGHCVVELSFLVKLGHVFIMAMKIAFRFKVLIAYRAIAR